MVTTVIMIVGSDAAWGRLPHRLGLKEKKYHSENIITFSLNSMYSLTTGLTILISYNCDVLQNNKL